MVKMYAFAVPAVILMVFCCSLCEACNVGDIFTPAADGDIHIIRAFLQIDPGQIEARDAIHGWTPLFYAARKGRLEMVEFLLSRGARIDARDRAGSTPLFFCTARKRVVKYLLLQGADVNIRNGFSSTPLHAAAQFAKADVVAMLLDYGAEINARNEYGETPLRIATILGRSSVATLLRSRGATE